MELDKTELMNNLLDLYGGLLTENQLNVMELYYMNDLSLSEIAEELSVTRSAVHDTLKKASAMLEMYESKLGLLDKEKEKRLLLDMIDELSIEEIKKMVEKL
ncbi:MAG: YlxM family DNA-binding protein [Bacilli bacterium]|nr:YlxM family DNA-binding protein [Bacilli bacterium]